jgi:hypothetical protein
MRVLRKLNLTTPITILYDEETESYIVRQGECLPDRITVEDITLAISSGSAGETVFKADNSDHRS